MSKEFRKEFIGECIKNRSFLGYSYNDVANSLVDVSEQNYIDFEEGKYAMSDENIKRLIKVLCIKKPINIDVEKYIDVTGLDDVEVEDLSKMVSIIVGDEND